MTGILYHEKYLNMKEIEPIKEKLITFRFSKDKIFCKTFVTLQVYENKYRFILEGYDMVKYLVVDFDKEGNYIGIDMVIINARRPKGSAILSGTNDYKRARTEEINNILRNFRTMMIANNYLK